MPAKASEHNINVAADYFEALARAKVFKAMQQLRKETKINDLALLIANKQPVVIDRNRIRELLGPLRKVVRDAYNHGGRLGAGKVRNLSTRRG